MTEIENFGSRIIKSIVSFFVGAAIGVIIAIVVANSLVEISLTYVFSIIFGIALILLSLALGWRIWTSVTETSKRIFLLFFAFLVFLSGIFSFVLEKNLVHIPPSGKIPMYTVLGVALSFALTFSITEFLNMGICDRCCNTDFENHPLIGSKRQVFIIFSGTLLMGAIFGVLFGTIDVENDDSNHSKFRENYLIGIPIGLAIGGFLGFVNQWLRSTPRQYYTWESGRQQLLNNNI